MKNIWGATLVSLISLLALAGAIEAQISQEAHTARRSDRRG